MENEKKNSDFDVRILYSREFIIAYIVTLSLTYLFGCTSTLFITKNSSGTTQTSTTTTQIDSVSTNLNVK